MWTDNYNTLGERLGFSIALALATVALAFFVPFSISLFVDETKVDIVHKETVPLVGVKDGTENSGGFFLFAGSFDGELVHRYYFKTSYGVSYKEVAAETGRSYIYIKEGTDKPRLEILGPERHWSWRMFSLHEHALERYVFHIPENSLKVGFTLDGE